MSELPKNEPEKYEPEKFSDIGLTRQDELLREAFGLWVSGYYPEAKCIGDVANYILDRRNHWPDEPFEIRDVDDPEAKWQNHPWQPKP